MRVSALVGTVLVALLPTAASFSLGVAPASRRFVAVSQSQPAAALRVPATPVMVEAKEEKGEEKENMMQQVKDAGVAGIISYIFWEWAFWGVSVPVALFGFQAATGYWPDFSDQDDLAKLGAEAFAFVNVARFAVPLRISLALGTTPWVRDNIVSKIEFLQDKKDKK